MSLMEIECDLRLMGEYPSIGHAAEKKKRGRYHGSNFWDVPKYGSKKWVIAVNIDISRDISDDMPAIDIARACIAYLNKPPPRKKYAKRCPKPKYGKLELYTAKMIHKDGDKYVSALLITDMRKNPFFWGKGKII